ncbi:MAG: flagellin [Candidatus Hydrogenedentes bacterium]|nr:flagellin [Candidatus Hydrogenedentota bacterium]
MGMHINQANPTSPAVRQAGAAGKALNKNLAALASGLRIGQAADDAAGLTIAEGLRARVRQFTRESENLQSGISMIQTAEGGLASQQEGVGRLRELATEAANGTLTDDQRAALQTETQQVLEQIEATAQGTDFNGRQLLNGTATETELGVEGGARVEIQSSTLANLGLEGVDLSTQEGAQAAIETFEKAGEQISGNQALLGAQQNNLERAVEVRETGAQALTEAESRIRDVDVARAAIERSRNEVLLRASFGAIAQNNLGPQMALRLLGL